MNSRRHKESCSREAAGSCDGVRSLAVFGRGASVSIENVSIAAAVIYNGAPQIIPNPYMPQVALQ